MPELPETEVVARELKQSCHGACIENIEILHPEILDNRSDTILDWYHKAVIHEVKRHGKHILLTTVNGQGTRYLGIRLGMTGQLLKQNISASRVAHTHAVIHFVDCPFELHFRDPRRFGRVLLLSTPLPTRQGMDPFTIPKADFIKTMAQGRGRIKSALMNQKTIAGIGNIYANEILFEARIHPHQRINRLDSKRLTELFRVMKKVLRRGIQKGGTTIRDFRSLHGMPGRFQEFLKIYGKAGKPCPQAGCSGTIRLLRPTPQAQPSFYCPICQRKK
ncbi:MAG: bifunctional DNA-formamidopyrimidine glycosylase/DNA-(apurinic or apyrimidinic site) lyase [Nitrospira sp.]|nr:bifunctional DNA-formamidopyrimidine glycosylase/DNA-(apurinic or apyrimidinic site) lyase [Nitrospira sp.]